MEQVRGSLRIKVSWGGDKLGRAKRFETVKRIGADGDFLMGTEKAQAHARGERYMKARVTAVKEMQQHIRKSGRRKGYHGEKPILKEGVKVRGMGEETTDQPMPN